MRYLFSQAWNLVLHHGAFKADETTKTTDFKVFLGEVCIAPFLSRIVHVTSRKEGTFWREEERGPWERSWNTDTKKQTRHRSRANSESKHSAQLPLQEADAIFASRFTRRENIYMGETTAEKYVCLPPAT